MQMSSRQEENRQETLQNEKPSRPLAGQGVLW